MRLKIIFVFILIFIFIGCAARNVPKDQLAVSIKYNDWGNYLGEYFDNVPEKDRWNNCFDISDTEFKKEIVEIYEWCVSDFMDRKYDKLPEKLTVGECSRIGTSIDQCAKIKYIVKNKDKFVFDKHTEHFDHCVEMYNQIIKKLE